MRSMLRFVKIAKCLDEQSFGSICISVRDRYCNGNYILVSRVIYNNEIQVSCHADKWFYLADNFKVINKYGQLYRYHGITVP